MAAKTRCPACGAKNDVENHRCRICTAVINPDAAKPAATEEPVTPLGIDHFDPGEIDRQVRPARERFGSSDGALTARIAAAQGSSTELSLGDVIDDIGIDDPGTGGTDITADVPTSFEPLPTVASPGPAVAAPIEYADEPFDPDALFREMG